MANPLINKMSNKRCARCEKTVYPLEELKCLDKIWHKGCFKCQECNMTLSMKTYKGFNKLPYCESHIPKAKATTVAETPEMKRLAENTKIQSNVQYHAEFEKSKAKFTQVADDPETLRLKTNTKNSSNVAYHGDLKKKEEMEKKRTADEEELARERQHEQQQMDQLDQLQNMHIKKQQHLQQQQQHLQQQQQHLQQQQQLAAASTASQQAYSGGKTHQYPPQQQQQQQLGYGQQQQLPKQNNGNSYQRHYQQQVNNNNSSVGGAGAAASHPYPAQQQQQPPAAAGQHPTMQNLQRDSNHNSSPYSSRNSQTLVYTSQQGAVPESASNRGVGSIADYDPVNEQFGSISQPQRSAARGHNQQAARNQLYGDPNSGQHYHPQQQQQQYAQQQQQQQYAQQQQHYPIQQQQQQQQPPPQQQQQQQPKITAQPTNLGRCYQALYDYEAADTDEISFQDGDLITNCSGVDEGWMTGTVQRTNVTGMLPANYVRRVS